MHTGAFLATQWTALNLIQTISRSLKLNCYFIATYLVQLSGKNVCDNIIKFHALTGCETTSYFDWIEKIKPFQKVLKNTDSTDLFPSLGKFVFVSVNERYQAIASNLFKQFYTMETTLKQD